MGLLLALMACRDDPTASTAPFAVEPSLNGSPTFEVGAVVEPAPTFVVRDAMGRPLVNQPVTISITGGSGTLTNAATRTGDGPTPIGTWTLDTIAGANTVTILAGSAPPVVMTLHGQAGAPQRIEVTGAGQTALAGHALDEPLLIHVVDRYGNPIPGIDVSVEIESGGGDVTPNAVRTTGKAGATEVSWTLGRLGGRQRITARAGSLTRTITAAIRSDFAPVIRTSGTVPAAFQDALNSALDRLPAIVTGDLVDIPVHNFDLSRCGIQGAALNELVDDVVIYATVVPIDGVDNIIASAGPCVSRTQSRLPVIGVLRVDAADIPVLVANGRLTDVVLHELLHVLGIGTVWLERGLLDGYGSADPRFRGSLAASQCVAVGGGLACGDQRVPVEGVGGGGTAYVHWRESTFDHELMTGFIESDVAMPLSRLSVASLEDIGYTVNLFSADAYTVPVAPDIAARLRGIDVAPWESTAPAPFEVTPDGWVRKRS